MPVDSTALFPACLFRALSQVSVLFFRRCAVFVAPVFSAVLFWWLCFRRFAGIWLSGSRFVRVCGDFGQFFVGGLLQSSRYNLSLKADPVPSGFFGFVLSFVAAPVGLARALAQHTKMKDDIRTLFSRNQNLKVFPWIGNTGQLGKLFFVISVEVLWMPVTLLAIAFGIGSFFSVWPQTALVFLILTFGFLLVLRYRILYSSIKCPQCGANPTRTTDNVVIPADDLFPLLYKMEKCHCCGWPGDSKPKKSLAKI